MRRARTHPVPLTMLLLAVALLATAALVIHLAAATARLHAIRREQQLHHRHTGEANDAHR